MERKGGRKGKVERKGGRRGRRREKDRNIGKVERGKKREAVDPRGLCNTVHEYLASCASSLRMF